MQERAIEVVVLYVERITRVSLLQLLLLEEALQQRLHIVFEDVGIGENLILCLTFEEEPGEFMPGHDWLVVILLLGYDFCVDLHAVFLRSFLRENSLKCL